MANEQNLIPANQRSKSEARANSSKGGIASGVSRRNKKTLKETLKALLELKHDVDGVEIKGNAAIGIALIKQALNGNVKAFEVIRDTIGEKPVSGISLEGNDSGMSEIKISFVDKSTPGVDCDPKIIGEYTPPIKTEK